MRSETSRLATGALDAKTARLAWLLDAHPSSRAELLLVDEDPDGTSATVAAARITAADRDAKIRITIARRPDGASRKGGAVLWGLCRLADTGHTHLAHTHCDLIYPLDHSRNGAPTTHPAHCTAATYARHGGGC
ncbi:hypothetical protein ACFXJO_20960 [Streptomyces lavendulae]|uniref:hypothetical protein n=1 Tax=Streptomyces lavendulae TaxID=1914 RepID=UPI00367AB460